MKKIFYSPLFWIGLAIRLGLIAMVLPTPVITWYAPFLSASIDMFSLDPWGTWLNEGGSPLAFPYGYAMWLVFLPLTALAKLCALPVYFGYALTLLAADFSLLQLFRKMNPDRDRLLLAVYWLSPIVILANYYLGYNDIIPVLFLTYALFCLQRYDLMRAGIACIAAISAKLSMILALPFFAIYLLHHRSVRRFYGAFLKGAFISALVLFFPLAFLHAGITMLVTNPEMDKVYRLAFDLGNDTFIYLVPLVYFGILYATWRIYRLNFQLLYTLMGLSFLMLVLMTPASPGWFIWTIPLLVTYQATTDRIAIVLIAIFSLLYALSSIVPMSITHTLMVGTGIILSVRIWRETISQNDYFRLSRKPFVIGIAGDSGAGKDTFSDALQGLFGTHSVTTLSGDDYHLWDRQKPMWQVMTHLNPMANDLERFTNDLIRLTDGKTIQARHYDHQTGQMSRPHRIRSNPIIIASGLHALYTPLLRECYNLSIYLDIDENLRRHFKIERDVNKRGHTLEKVLASFAKREPDAARFIRPQAELADLVLSLRPIHPRLLEKHTSTSPLRFKLVAHSRHGFNELSLTRILVGVCGLHVDMVTSNQQSDIELTIEGETSAEDIALAARMICPTFFEFLDIHPEWQGGILGLMQLITLSHINQAFTKRILC